MKIFAKTDVGRHRKNNEDSYFTYHNEKITGGMVADGIGGHNCGELASKMAVDYIKQYIISEYDPSIDYMKMAELIKEAFAGANRQIFNMAKNPENEGMGTTATLAFVYDGRLIIAHIGDSRCYKLTKGKAVQLTKDHSYVGELLRSGYISQEDARSHPNKNVITRALGTEPYSKVDIDIMRYNGETVLICTDGLTNMISDEQIKMILYEDEEPDVSVEKMIELANKKGGYDNITAILIKDCK